MEITLRVHLFTAFVYCIKVSSLKNTHINLQMYTHHLLISQSYHLHSLYEYICFHHRFILKRHSLRRIQVVMNVCWCDCFKVYIMV